MVCKRFAQFFTLACMLTSIYFTWQPALHLLGAMESKASFKERAKEIGIPDDTFTKPVTICWYSFVRLAYVCATNSTSGDDSELEQALENLLEEEVTPDG